MNIQSVEVVHDDPDAVKAAPVLPEIEEQAAPKAHKLPADFPENAAPVGDGSFLLRLDYPVTLKFRDTGGGVKEEHYRELHLKRLNGKAQREISQASTDDFRPQMLASSTGMTFARAKLLHDAMDAADIAAAMIVVRFFTTPGRMIGP